MYVYNYFVKRFKNISLIAHHDFIKHKKWLYIDVQTMMYWTVEWEHLSENGHWNILVSKVGCFETNILTDITKHIPFLETTTLDMLSRWVSDRCSYLQVNTSKTSVYYHNWRQVIEFVVVCGQVDRFKRNIEHQIHL